MGNNKCQGGFLLKGRKGGAKNYPNSRNGGEVSFVERNLGVEREKSWEGFHRGMTKGCYPFKAGRLSDLEAMCSTMAE